METVSWYARATEYPLQPNKLDQKARTKQLWSNYA